MEQQRGFRRAIGGGRGRLWRFRWSRGGVVVNVGEGQRQRQQQIPFGAWHAAAVAWSSSAAHAAPYATVTGVCGARVGRVVEWW